MPDRYDMANLPDPQSPYITLDKQKAKRFAVIRFSGAVRQKQGVANLQLMKVNCERRLNKLICQPMVLLITLSMMGRGRRLSCDEMKY